MAKNILANVHEISIAEELWEKLEAMYKAKSISNWLYLKEQFHTLRMVEGMKISNHLGILNDIVSELVVNEVNIYDEDKALKLLILSLPPSYEHMKAILMYRNETLDFDVATSIHLSNERRLKSEGCDVSHVRGCDGC